MVLKIGSWPNALFSLGLAYLAVPASAVEHKDHAQVQLCHEAAIEAARKHGIPHSVLISIALTETGRRIDGKLVPWPWAVNIEGKGQWFASREAAEAHVLRAHALGKRSYDVGCFQINYRWHRKAFDSPISLFDPQTGADYAARFLSALHEEMGDWNAAAGAYHSRTPKFAERYRRRFEAIRNAHLHLDGMPQTAPAARHADNRIPILISGNRLSHGSLFVVSGERSALINFGQAKAAIFDD